MAKKATKVVDMSPEEVSKREMESKREEITAYYKDSIKHLKVQVEYETLLKDIEVARAERIQSQMFIAQTMAGPEGVTPPQDNGESRSQAGSDWDAEGDTAPPVRKLKRADV